MDGAVEIMLSLVSLNAFLHSGEKSLTCFLAKNYSLSLHISHNAVFFSHLSDKIKVNILTL